MKKILIGLAIAVIPVLFINCSSRYFIVQSENPAKFRTKDYKNIHIGWIDFDVNKFKEYGYETQTEWVKGIRELNVDNLQYYTKSYISGKTVTGAESKSSALPAESNLLVKFSDVDIHKGEDSMRLKIHFIDTKSKAEIYMTDLLIKRRSSWSEYSASGRILTMMEQLAAFLSEKIR